MKQAKKQTILMVTIATAVLMNAACKKSTTTQATPTTPQSTKDMIIGKWDVIRDGHDDNDNGKLDSNEVHYRNKDMHKIYASDGTGTMLYMVGGVEHSSSYQWSLSGNLLLIKDDGYYRTDTMVINTITSTDLTYHWNNDWYVFTKNKEYTGL